MDSGIKTGMARRLKDSGNYLEKTKRGGNIDNPIALDSSSTEDSSSYDDDEDEEEEGDKLLPSLKIKDFENFLPV